MFGRLSAVVVAICMAFPAVAQSVSAVLEPAKIAEIRPTVAGRLSEIAVAEGDQVVAGAKLAQMDNAVQMARVSLAQQAAEAQGQLQRAAAATGEAEAFVVRVDQAHARGAAQNWEVTAARQALKLAQAEQVIAQEAQRQAEGQLALEQATLSEFELRAPFDGTVLQIFREPGEIVDTQQSVITLGHLRTLEATGFFPVDQFSDLEVGRTFRATVDNGRAQSETVVTVISVDPRIDPASRTVRVTIELPNGDLSFAAGATIVIDPA